MKTNIIVTVIVAAVIALGVVYISREPKESVTPSKPLPVGSVVGPEITSEFLIINGITTWYRRAAVLTGTTTICALPSPKNATSTLLSALVRLSTASTTATIIEAAKATTPFATTTALGDIAVAANTQATMAIQTPTTTTALAPATIFAPGTYFTVGLKGGDVAGKPAGLLPVGYCQAVFREI